MEVKVIKILGCKTSDLTILAAELMDVYSDLNEKEKSSFIEIVIKNYQNAPESDYPITKETLDEDLWQNYGKRYSQNIRNFFNDAYITTKDIHEFATRIINILKLIPESGGDIFVMSILLRMPLWPYKKSEINNEAYLSKDISEIVKENSEIVDQIQYCMVNNFASADEIAILATIISKIDDIKTIAALLVVVRELFKRRYSDED